MTDLDKITKLHESDNYFVLFENNKCARVYAEQIHYMKWEEIPYVTLYFLNKNLEITGIFQNIDDWNHKLEAFTKTMADGNSLYSGLTVHRKER